MTIAQLRRKLHFPVTLSTNKWVTSYYEHYFLLFAYFRGFQTRINPITINIRRPYFAEMYQRIIQLWRTGGIYSDFTYHFLGHLEDWSAHLKIVI
jgi:hypothetical protein